MLALLAGLCFPLGLAPYGIWPFAIASVVALLYCLRDAQALQSLGYLLVYGIGMYAVGASWLYEALIILGDVEEWLAVLLSSTFVLFYAGFFTLTVFFAQIWIRTVLGSLLRSHSALASSIAWCAGWLIYEQINYSTSLDTSFPWLHIGYAFTDTWVASLASIGGVTLVGLCAFVMALGILEFPRWRLWSMVAIGVPWFAGALVAQQHWTNAGEEVDVALVQANVSLQEKWEDSGFVRSWEAHVDLTAQIDAADLIVWPEVALPAYEDELHPHFRYLTEGLDATLVIGAIVRRGFDGPVYNAVVVLEPGYERVGKFLKTKLVPFGEYTPFSWLFGPIRDAMDIKSEDYSKGSMNQQPLTISCCTFGVSVCYEVAFPMLIAERARNTDFIVASSEDAWFGNSLGPAQHMQISRMRAIETGRYLIRSTSNGITGIVDPKGRLVHRLPRNEPGVLRMKITKMEGSTPFMYLAAFIGSIASPFFGIGAAIGLPLVALVARPKRPVPHG